MESNPYSEPTVATDEPAVPIQPPAEPVQPHIPGMGIQKKRKLLPWQIGAIGAIVVIVLLTALVAFSAYGYKRQVGSPIATGGTPTSTALVSSATPAPTATPVAALLNGALVEPGKENIRPLAVMIENHPDARPQAGLGQADLVVEAIAEGGITRFMAVFADPTKAVRVGPVRSARTYYVDFATELGAFYAHVGGSEPALAQIKNTGVLDLNQFAVGEPVYKRDFSRNVPLEHTMYSSTDKLFNYATTTKGWSKTADFKSWLFQDDAAQASRPASEQISVSVSDPTYKVVWNYDPTTNSYLRTMAGKPHIDANTNKQITTKNIVLQTVNRTSLTESNQKVIWDYTLVGSGQATIFQNGVATKATWKKDGTARTRYYDTTGKEISFVRGTTWVHLVHSDSTISY